MIKKSIIIFILSCTVGAGYILGGSEPGDSFPLFDTEVHQRPKKITAVKPKSFYSKRRTASDKNGFASEQFSFFPVLSDPSLSKIVGLNGDIIEKFDSSPIVAKPVRFEEKVPRKISPQVQPVRIEKAIIKIPVPAIQQAKLEKIEVERKKIEKPKFKIPAPKILPSRRQQTVRVEPKKVEIRQEPDNWLKKVEALSFPEIVSFVVQVSAFRQVGQADNLKAYLETKGYPAFIGKTEIQGSGGAWYRVYIGRYFNHAGAQMAADSFYRKENHKAVVVRQSG